jgi:FSR family fosmidomycin resistance protein-like MFS transporter
MSLPRNRLFWAVSLGHITNDTFMSMRSVLLTFMSAHVLPMTNLQIGQTISLGEFIGAVSQPFFGWLADRTGGRWIGALGVVWVIALQLVALLIATATGNYLLMMIPFALASLGSGAFHPVGVMHAVQGDARRSASAMAYFFLFGQLGLALGPALAGALLDQTASHNNKLFSLGPAFSGVLLERGSLSPIFALGVVAIPSILIMAITIPSMRAYAQQHPRPSKPSANAPRASFSLPVRPLLILSVMILLRSLAANGSGVFLPRLFEQKGWDAAQYGLITGSFWLASGITGVLFGHLADHVQRRTVIAVSLLLSSPVFFILPFIDGIAAFLLAIAAGALGGGSHSLIVLQAQELIPGRKGFASGAIMGFIFATGALGSLFIGAVSDQIGLTATFQVVAVVTGVASLLGFLLPADTHKRQPQPAVESALPSSA